MKKSIQNLLWVGVALSPILSGCVANDSAEPSPSDTDVDQYLNPSDASDQAETELDQTNREWLDETRQKSRLNRYR